MVGAVAEGPVGEPPLEALAESGGSCLFGARPFRDLWKRLEDVQKVITRQGFTVSEKARVTVW